MKTWIDIVFDGPPSHESGRFVEVETHEGKSIRYGEWIHREDGFWVLRIPDSKTLTVALDQCVEALEAQAKIKHGGQYCFCDRIPACSDWHALYCKAARAALEQARKARG